MMKFNKYILISALLISFALHGTTFAQDNSDIDPNIDGNMSVARCAEKGNIDYIIFLRSIIWSDGFYEGTIEPWNDIIGRNQCHTNDIVGLIWQRDKIRSYIRDAFLTCNTQKLPNMRRAYNEVNAEIYYVRHIVDGSVVIGMPYDILSLEGEFFYTPREEIYADMYQRYVFDSGQFSKTDFDQLFNRFELKYGDRKENYVVCEHSSWEAVSEKWDEFIETSAGLTPAFEDLEKSVGGRAEKISQAATDEFYEDFLDSWVQFNINNQDAKAGFAEILSDAGEAFYSPDFESNDITYDVLLSGLETEDFRFDVETMEITLSARFEALYKENSDAAVESMLGELDGLNEAIQDGFPLVDRMYNCVYTMNNRQCAVTQ